jgi:Tfp pilus assembly protein FimT
MAVIVIVGLISAVAISRFREMPAFITLESKVNQLKKVLSQARNSAVCQGVNTEVVFDSAKRCIFIPQASSSEDGKAEDGRINKTEILLPEEIKIFLNGEKIETDSEKKTLFKFYPDGAGGGNTVSFELDNEKIKLSISPLSGSIITEEMNKTE